MSGAPPRIALAEAASAYIATPWEDMVDSTPIGDDLLLVDRRRPHVTMRLSDGIARCQHCRARQRMHRTHFEPGFRAFSCVHQSCQPRGAGRSREASPVSRVVPPPRTAATPAPRTQRASWHGGPGGAEAGRPKPAKATRVDVRDEHYTHEPDEEG